MGDPQAAPSDTFLDLYAALVTPAGIGINLLGETWYAQYTAGRGIDEQMILIAANSRILLSRAWTGNTPTSLSRSNWFRASGRSDYPPSRSRPCLSFMPRRRRTFRNAR